MDFDVRGGRGDDAAAGRAIAADFGLLENGRDKGGVAGGGRDQRQRKQRWRGYRDDEKGPAEVQRDPWRKGSGRGNSGCQERRSYTKARRHHTQRQRLVRTLEM